MQHSKIAITGGIGSGKSFVCRLLGERGISVYDCDAAAKRLIRESATLQQSLQQLVGPQVFCEDVLQKSVLARYILQGDAHREAVNDVVHPYVARDFEASDYDWLESAILFDSGFYRRTHFDHVICVSAPLEVRIARVIQRDGLNRERVLEWMGRQWTQEQVLARSDFEIVNDGRADLHRQIDNIINQL